MLIGWKAAVHDPRVASFRYRVQEPIAALRERGHQVELFSPQHADRYDLTVFCKSYRPADQEIARAAKARGGAVALDLCDNHFYNPYHLPRYQKARDELLAMIGLADRVIVSTPALGAVVRAEAALARDPWVVGDAAERVTLPPRTPSSGRTLLWFGSHGSPNAPSGMNDLIGIAPALREAAAATPFELVVASNNREKFDVLAPRMDIPMRYVEWTREGFPALLAQADAVVIPLSDNPFVACKTHNRLTIALWPGVPVIADAIESYREFAPFCHLDDWRGGLAAALGDNAAARSRAAGARAYIEDRWSIARIAQQWETALGLAPAPRDAMQSNTIAPAGPSVQHQGALDPPRDDRVTGWARMIARPADPVRVTLQAEGRIVARARADRPRPDLATAGFEFSACGFELPVPAFWRDGSVRHYAVAVEGGPVLETHRASFGPGILPAAPRTIEQQVQAVGALASAIAGQASGADRMRDEMRMQRLLADELEALSEAVENVRRTAARIVLTAGGRGHAPLENEAPRADGGVQTRGQA